MNTKLVSFLLCGFLFSCNSDAAVKEFFRNHNKAIICVGISGGIGFFVGLLVQKTYNNNKNNSFVYAKNENDKKFVSKCLPSEELLDGCEDDNIKNQYEIWQKNQYYYKKTNLENGLSKFGLYKNGKHGEKIKLTECLVGYLSRNKRELIKCIVTTTNDKYIKDLYIVIENANFRKALESGINSINNLQICGGHGALYKLNKNNELNKWLTIFKEENEKKQAAEDNQALNEIQESQKKLAEELSQDFIKIEYKA
jgi:hypothetical protein